MLKAHMRSTASLLCLQLFFTARRKLCCLCTAVTFKPLAKQLTLTKYLLIFSNIFHLQLRKTNSDKLCGWTLEFKGTMVLGTSEVWRPLAMHAGCFVCVLLQTTVYQASSTFCQWVMNSTTKDRCLQALCLTSDLTNQSEDCQCHLNQIYPIWLCVFGAAWVQEILISVNTDSHGETVKFVLNGTDNWLTPALSGRSTSPAKKDILQLQLPGFFFFSNEMATTVSPALPVDVRPQWKHVISRIANKISLHANWRQRQSNQIKRSPLYPEKDAADEDQLLSLARTITESLVRMTEQECCVRRLVVMFPGKESNIAVPAQGKDFVSRWLCQSVNFVKLRQPPWM